MTIILGVNIVGISVSCIRGRGGVNCNCIIKFIFLLFQVFHAVGGVWGKFLIPQ